MVERYQFLKFNYPKNSSFTVIYEVFRNTKNIFQMIRQLRDKTRLAEAKLALKTFQNFLKSLDLEFEIQFYPLDPAVDDPKLPVIKKAVSLSKSLF